MILNNRIIIYKKDMDVANGRWEERQIEYYSCWCEPSELYGKELYESQNIKYENVLVFRVRYCNTIKNMRKTDKNKFLIEFEDTKYQVYQVDFKNNSKDYVYIKARMLI